MRTTSPIASLFGRSPFRPLQEHMRVVEACAEAILPLFEALESGDRQELIKLKEKIFELEGQADDLKNDIRSHLPRSLFMPVDRRDLLELLSSQDSIADTIQDIAGLLVLRNMEIPRHFDGILKRYLSRNLDATRQCGKVIGELDELVEMGFRGKQVDRVLEMIAELGAIETETDDIGVELTTALFDHEDEMKPLAVIFWYEMLQLIGDVADYAEDVGDRLRLLIAR
ncbi:MAG TPA: TIGR00153 family protein [Vicinamibacteria bacterium]|nr:TIGR00153 family protein [Vicinamibacteria bacterium]